jgi:hypothetical protein
MENIMEDILKRVLSIHQDEYDGDDSGYEEIQLGRWIESAKNSYKTDIVRYDDRYFMISESRYGSYHTDYFYDDPEISEVEREVKVVEQVFWKPINK